MSRDSIVVPLRQPEVIDDPLSELAREGARRMLAQVLIAEADCFVALWKDLKLLEERLGVKLLARTTRGLTATEAGLNFYERARRSIEEAERGGTLRAYRGQQPHR